MRSVTGECTVCRFCEGPNGHKDVVEENKKIPARGFPVLLNDSCWSFPALAVSWVFSSSSLIQVPALSKLFHGVFSDIL